jgi:hypothetical protein
MALLPLFASTNGRVRIAQITAFSTIPRRFRRTKQCIDRGTLFISWCGVPQV